MISEAVAHFAAKLNYETDPSDVYAALESGAPDFILIDTRSPEAWEQGHIVGAQHLPTREIAGRAAREVPDGKLVVTYCWGPGCNGSTRAALEFAKLGYPVREMIGGFEYWAREGLPVADANGLTTAAADPLTAVCGC